MQRLLVHSLAPNMRDVDIIYLFPPGCPPIVEIARESPTAHKATVSFATEARLVPVSNCRLVSRLVWRQGFTKIPFSAGGGVARIQHAAWPGRHRQHGPNAEGMSCLCTTLARIARVLSL
jgi:hypothetical protein